GGAVSISSEHERGTRVTITLPGPRGRRVFVADHDAGTQAAAADTLRRAGYLVTEAEDGDLALYLLSGAETDAVVLDVGMPGRDGLAVLAELGEGPPVVVVTGDQLDEDALRDVYGGVAALLRKPALEPDLLRAVARAMRFEWPGHRYPTVTSSHG
ncbi:MAG TPA: response regulator, partial [Acidimicrobiales bacterium]|nr:response regulator [Acidimicrobiales bacterium]